MIAKGSNATMREKKSHSEKDIKVKYNTIYAGHDKSYIIEELIDDSTYNIRYQKHAIVKFISMLIVLWI